MNKGMKKHVMKAAACFLAGSMTIAAGGMTAMAAGNTLVGVGTETEQNVAAEQTEQSVETETAAEETVSEEVQETEAPQENVINTVAVAQIGEESYINIRTNPSTESDIVGKLYDCNAATILGEEGDWYYIQSGNCVGYVAKYLMTTGSEAQQVVQEIGTPVAQVNAEALMVRTDASEDAEVMDMVMEDEIVYLEEDLGGWAKVSTDNGTGFVSADYVSYATYLPQAESVEEEAARIAAENAAWEAYLAEQERLYLEEMARQQAEWEAQNQAWIEYLQSQGTYTEPEQGYEDQSYDDGYYEEDYYVEDSYEEDYYVEDSYEGGISDEVYDNAVEMLEDAGVDPSEVTVDDGTSSLRQQVVDYALQFVGNPYVWGGTSLTNGADCSGFTQSVMHDNGIDINRTAGAQGQGGTSVSLDEIQPGDLLFYEGSGDYGIGHVTMYIGDGQVVHASNSTDGIIVSDIDYRTPAYAKSYLD